jgi:hypothetical protein
MPNLRALIDAVEAVSVDIEAHVDLPRPYSVWLYSTPPTVTPELTPLLVVALGSATWNRIATPAVFELVGEITVTWHISREIGAQTGGVGDPEAIVELATIGDQIAERLTAMSEGIPGVTGTYARLTTTRIEPVEAAVWAARFDLEVRE